MSRKKHMSRKKLTIASLVAIPVVAGLGFAVTGSAFAGSNGQQVELCQNLAGTVGTDYRIAVIQGTNQNGQPQTHEVRDLTPDCTTVRNFWWKGDVSITWSSPVSRNAARQTTPCRVPENILRDTFRCEGPVNLAGTRPPDPF